VLTKFASYGQVTPPRQAELIRELGKPKSEAVDQPGQNWAQGFDYPLAGATALIEGHFIEKRTFVPEGGGGNS
jgi:hypothetical protein